MELLLTKEKLWNVVTDDVPDPVTDDWNTKDKQARATIGLLLEDSQLHIIRKETTAKATWTALQRYHEKSTLSSKVSLLKKICALKLTEEGDMSAHLAHMEDLVDQLASLGEPLAEHLTVALMLSSLPDSYGTLITALETRPEDDLTKELVKNKLLEEYSRRQESGMVPAAIEQRAMKAKDEKHSAATSRITCFFCKKPGHLKRDCRKYSEWKRKNPNHKVKQITETEDNSLDEGSEEASYVCFAVYAEATDWYVDSGASAHMTSDLSFFTSLDTEHKRTVTLANGQKLLTAGIGEGFVRCVSGDGDQLVKLTEVLHVPDLRGNLISVKKLTSKEFQVCFRGKQCFITKADKTIASATEHLGLYKLDISDSVRQVFEGKQPECIHVWHNRLGHRDPNVIRDMDKRQTAKNFHIKPCTVLKTCECCLKAKMARKPLPKKSDTVSTEILDLIHTDICGPMQTQTPGGNRYFMTMIDDCSKHCTVYLLKHKSEAASKIKEYVKYVQTKFGKSPKIIRSDRGGEYTTGELQNFLKSEGIQMQMTAPYTPQQNGRAERKNRYLTEMTRSMLIDANMPNKYWGEALLTANHLQNRLPTSGEYITPEEKWSGRKPSLSYIRRFGCKAYMAIPAEKRRKLDDKAKKLVFVGYESGSKAYRLLDMTTDKIFISRDVHFIEGDHHDGQFLSSTAVKSTPVKSEKTDDAKLEQIMPDFEVEVNLFEPQSEGGTEPTGDLIEQPQQHTVEERRSARVNKGKPPQRLIEAANQVTNELQEPRNYQEALTSAESDEWIKAMNVEMQSLNKNKTWTLTTLPEGKTAIGSKWVYKAKRDETGNITRFKARLVAQGYSQKYGHDYDEVFAPVVKPVTIRTLLTIAGQSGMIVKHYDIEAAFLNGDISHEVYMKQPEGFEVNKDHYVCKLQKSLYGLKQGAKEWNKKIHDILCKNGFTRSENDPCLYSQCKNGDWIYIAVHVDDLILAATNSSLVKDFEDNMSKVFTLKKLGNLKYYLGMQFDRDENGIFSVHQQKYIEEKLHDFDLEDSRPSNIPMDPGYQKRQEVPEDMTDRELYRRAIGSLLYLAVNTRPDIAVSTSILSRHVENPKQADWIEVKRIFRYLKKTKDKKLKLGATSENQNNDLIVYVDADWGGDAADRKSNSGYCMKFMGSTIAWRSRKQSLVTLSSTEAEYIALTEAIQEVLWLRRLLKDMNQEITCPITVFEDNQNCIRLLQNPKSSSRTKHIDVKYNFVRDLYQSKDIDLHYCASEHMIADLLTKPLESVKMRQLSMDIGLV